MPMSKKKQYVEPRENFTVRLFPSEKQYLYDSAELNGMKPSEYVRELILNGGKVDKNKPQDRRDLINQIARIGNNVNQVARWVNTMETISQSDIDCIMLYLKQIEVLMKEVLEKWQ